MKNYYIGVSMLLLLIGYNGCGESGVTSKDASKTGSLVKQDGASTKAKTTQLDGTSFVDEKKEDDVLKEKGSPVNPFSDSDIDNKSYDSNSPKNAKKVKEDLKNIPDGHPLKAQKIDKNDPDLLEKGSPANPIKDFTGQDILDNN